MNAGTAYAVITFLAGVLCLLGWLYATTDLPRSTAILKKSLWLILLPMLLTPASWFTFPLSMWVLVAFEEGVKAVLSEIFNPDIPFEQTTSEEVCRFCPYHQVCYR